MIFLWILLIVAALFGLWLFMLAPRLRRPALLKKLHAATYAHRGLHDIKRGVPENSMLAFRRAVEGGYGIELDVHLSRDGQLVVEHDDTLVRTCGVDLTIEQSDFDALRSLRLEGTEEHLPLLEEVLALVDGRVPLLIELKAQGNQAALAKAAYELLRSYHGDYCIESFDPRTLSWLRKKAPEVVRGQLAGYLRKDGSKISPVIDFALRNLLVNLLSRPDFIAYRWQDHRAPALKLCSGLFKAPLFFWTVRSPKGRKIAEECNAAPIFEQ